MDNVLELTVTFVFILWVFKTIFLILEKVT